MSQRFPRTSGRWWDGRLLPVAATVGADVAGVVAWRAVVAAVAAAALRQAVAALVAAAVVAGDDLGA